MRVVARYCLALFGLAVFTYGSLIIGKDGLSNLRVEQSIESASINSADEAIRLNRSNPDAYHARAALYQKAGNIAEAIKDFERALDLRPKDHFLWLELGYCRYQVQDMEGAIAAFRESARLAPSYSQPRWYLGNVLLQIGKADEGFAELRSAVASDPNYLTDVIPLANEVYGGDARAIVKAIQPQNSMTRLMLAQYFIKQNAVANAMELIQEGDLSATDQRTLLSDLLAAKKFVEAHKVWLANNAAASDEGPIQDGGFESEIRPEALGFEWQISPNLQRVAVVRDRLQPKSGSFCLRLDFGGISEPETQIISQLLLTEAAARYKLSFAFRTQKVVTGGPLVVAVLGTDKEDVLAQSEPLAENQTEWKDQSIEFSSPSDTQAVIVIIKRKACTSNPCPAFGRAWFDSFTCKKL